MKYKRFRIFHLLLAVTIAALIVWACVERRAVIGKSSTLSPDGDWCFNLRLVEFSTLFYSRKMLDADLEHTKNKEWFVTTSLPLDYASAKTISNLDPEHPIVWSDDSSTVKYWINEEIEDSIRIEANETRRIFQRDLYSTSVTYESKETGD